MATKAQIQAAIVAQLTGNAGLTTHAQHEEFLHTESDSILENIYGAVETDSQATETFTTKNIYFNYTISVFKNANTTTMTGTLFCNAAPPANITTIFTLTDSEKYGNGNGFAVNLADGSTMIITLFDQLLTRGAEVFAGETYTFSITYNTTD